MNEYYSLKRV